MKPCNAPSTVGVPPDRACCDGYSFSLGLYSTTLRATTPALVCTNTLALPPTASKPSTRCEIGSESSTGSTCATPFVSVTVSVSSKYPEASVSSMALSNSVSLLIFSPLMLGTALAIKLDDGGPIFFSQKRIGLHGKPFTMYKFRSMVTNAEELKKKLAEENGQTDRFIFKMKDDPRITKVGRFIRKTSLDEFPQFFNVLKGDMSLVGPRPALPEEVARYGSLYSARLLVKPGITGPWQVSGRSDLSQEQSEYLDVSYIENWSIAGDLAILAKTVLVVFRGTGSY